VVFYSFMNFTVENARLIPLDGNLDVTSAATDLHRWLSLPANHDIEKEFPGTAADFAIDEATAQSSLERIATRYVTGEREIFIVFAGEHAVGLSLVTLSNNPPDCVDPLSPNLSGYIAHPWRMKGLGKLSLLKRLEIVEANFGSNAWTLVNKTNYISERMVESVGFQKTSCDDPSVRQGYNLFTYSASS
jgi:L-amino acid N-acyltransferase YncA